jgi:hypothetical protein
MGPLHEGSLSPQQRPLEYFEAIMSNKNEKESIKANWGIRSTVSKLSPHAILSILISEVECLDII